MKLVNRVLPPPTARAAHPEAGPDAGPDARLFAPEGSAEGCASGECLPGETQPAGPEVTKSSAAALPLPQASRPEVTSPSIRLSEDDRWKLAVESLRQSSPRHGKSLSYARFLGFAEGGVRVAFPPDAGFHKTTVMGISRTIVETALTAFFQKPTRLIEETNVQTMQAAPKSIAEVEASDRAVRQTAIEKKVQEHPGVRNVLRILGGSIEHIQVLEVAPARPSAPTAASDDES